MSSIKKVLILTAPFGSGHLQVSGALVKEFKKYGDIEVEEYDLYSEEFPTLSKTLQKAYLKSYKPVGKDLYRMLYYGANQAIYDTMHAKLIKPYYEFGRRALKHKLTTSQPDAIISVFPVTSLYKLEDREFKVPLYTVITDYYATGLWLYKGARRHYVANNKIIAWGVANGLMQQQFLLTGIPVNEKFYQKLEKQEIYTKYKLDSQKKTVLVAAGAHGVVSKVTEMAEKLAVQQDVQVIVVCGRNEKLYEEVQTLTSTYDNVVVLGYCTSMNELLEITDLMVTKPGGLSLTEAAIKAVPVLLINPVYGQELENAKYFSDRKAAVIVANEVELIYHALIILNEDGMLEEMKQNIQSIACEYSAKEIVKDVMQDGEQYYHDVSGHIR